MRLGIAAGRARVRGLDPRRFSPGSREVVGTQGCGKQFGHRAGRGGDVTRVPRTERSASTREGFLRALPFSLPARPGKGLISAAELERPGWRIGPLPWPAAIFPPTAFHFARKHSNGAPSLT